MGARASGGYLYVASLIFNGQRLSATQQCITPQSDHDTHSSIPKLIIMTVYGTERFVSHTRGATFRFKRSWKIKYSVEKWHPLLLTELRIFYSILYLVYLYYSASAACEPNYFSHVFCEAHVQKAISCIWADGMSHDTS